MKAQMTILKNNQILTAEALKTTSLFERIKGLLGRTELKPQEALIFTPCTSIHTFFMKFPIDAIFLSHKGTIVGLYQTLLPNRMTRIYWNSRTVVECSAGSINRWNLHKGDELIIKEPHV